MRRNGFSLIEIITTMTIMIMVSGFVAFTYVSYQSGARLDSGAAVLKTAMQLARQSAVATGQARRLVIETRPKLGQSGSFPKPYQVFFWVEKKIVEGLPYWNAEADYPDHNYQLADESAEKMSMPERMVVVDVNGVRVFDPSREPDNPNPNDSAQFYDTQTMVQRFYVVFNGRGNVEAVFAYKDLENPQGYNGIWRKQQNKFTNLAFHVAETDAMFFSQEPLTGGVPETKYVFNQELSTSLDQLIPSEAPLFKFSGKDPPPAWEVTERRKVVTVFLLSMTGKSVIRDYGWKYPFPDTLLERSRQD